MHEYRPAFEDYIFTLYYQGGKYNVRVKQYYSDRHFSYYHITAKNKFIDVKYDENKKLLTEELQHGQPPTPFAFMQLVEKEFQAMK